MKRVAIAVAVSAALAFCALGVFALIRFSGTRGTVCLRLGAEPEIVSRLGHLTRCDSTTPGLFELEGPLGRGRAVVKTATAQTGEVRFESALVHTGGAADFEFTW